MSPLTVTWPGGIGNPAGEKIVTSGGKRKTRRNRKNRKQTRKNRSLRRSRAGCSRKNRTRRS